MKNKKGFTLVELLGTITILAIILTLGVSGFKNVTKKVNETTLQNKIAYIETGASKYASETGYKATNVDNLIKLGYISADNEAGEMINPTDGSKMNCHIVNISKEGDNYYGSYIDQEECDNEKLATISSNIGVNSYKTDVEGNKGEKIENGTWVNTDVVLEVYLKDENTKEEDVKKIIWQTNGGVEEVAINGDFKEKNTHKISGEQMVNTTVKVTIELKDGTTYQTEVKVKIDKQRPRIYPDETKIKDADEWTNYNKEVTVVATDGNTSGVDGYYIGTSDDCLNASYVPVSENSYTTNLDNGIYYICVKDKTGNVSEDKSTHKIEIKKVDKVPPVCKLSINGTMGENNWYTSNVDVSFIESETKDDASGIASKLIGNTLISNWESYTQTENTTHVTHVGKVYDRAGNEATCEISFKKDSEKPKVSAKASPLSLGSQDYNFLNGNVNYSFSHMVSGEGTISCDPSESKKTGQYNVTCRATGNNGLTTILTFLTRHNYPATRNEREESYECNCHTERWCNQGAVCTECNYEGCGATAYCCYGTSEGEVCDTCHRTVPYYTCPQGGNLSGTTCYY